MKIIFINQYVTHLFADIINDFTKKGAEVTLVTGSIHSSRKISGKVKIRKFVSYKRSNAFLRLLTWHIFGFRIFCYLLFQRKQVFLTTNPPFLPVIVWICHKLKKQPFHVIYYDLYPDALVKMGYISSKNPISKIWRSCNKKVVRDASNVFTISNRLKAGLESYNPLNKNIDVIPPWSDNALIKPLDKASNPFIERYQLQDKFIILYSGNLGVTHSVESLLLAAGRLQRHDDIVFLIIGEGARKRSVERYVAEKKLKNLLLLPWQSHDQLPYTFPSADIGVIMLGKGAEGLSVPSKTYDYLSAGCALLAIAGRESELGSLISGYRCGAIHDPDDIDGMAGFILEMKNDPRLLKEYKENSRKASYDFGKENAGKFYEIIYRKDQGN